MEYFAPGSFKLPTQGLYYFQDFLYYSFVTLSTLGYGDIIPTSGQAKSLSIVLSTLGQMYLTILVAILVGKYLNTQIIDRE